MFGKLVYLINVIEMHPMKCQGKQICWTTCKREIDVRGRDIWFQARDETETSHTTFSMRNVNCVSRLSRDGNYIPAHKGRITKDNWYNCALTKWDSILLSFDDEPTDKENKASEKKQVEQVTVMSSLCHCCHSVHCWLQKSSRVVEVVILHRFKYIC